VRPSIQESSRSRSTKAATRLASAAGVPWLIYPMIGSWPGCCARASNGHATAALPRRMMNSRRRMSPTIYHIIGRREHLCTAAEISCLCRFRVKLCRLEISAARLLYPSNRTLVGAAGTSENLHRTGLMHRSKKRHYSITSSAATSRPGGTGSPSIFAVLRLSTVSYLVGACTGRSAGLAPRSMRSM
jgi:hypothetical protein